MIFQNDSAMFFRNLSLEQIVDTMTRPGALVMAGVALFIVLVVYLRSNNRQ